MSLIGKSPARPDAFDKVTGGIAKIAETSSDFAAAKKKKPVRRTSKLAESSDSFDF